MIFRHRTGMVSSNGPHMVAAEKGETTTDSRGELTGEQGEMRGGGWGVIPPQPNTHPPTPNQPPTPPPTHPPQLKTST